MVCRYFGERQLFSLPVEVIPVDKAPDPLGNNRIVSPNERVLPEYQVREPRRLFHSAKIIAAHAFLHIKIAFQRVVEAYVVATVTEGYI